MNRPGRVRALAARVAVATCVVLGLSACGSGAGAADTSSANSSVRVGPPGAAFYVPPRHLPPGGHGTLIWARPFTGPVAVDGATNTLLLYEQRGVRGGIVATSGYLAVPRGQPPKGGWPVISWAHGTTGIADQCAPTRNPDELDQVTNGALLDQWLGLGYAVVRTDYEGLGTPGAHPYLDGVSEGRAMLDIVTAARELDPQLSNRVVLAGHSQGGHATLWAASLASRYAPNLDVRGAIAFAPVSHLADDIRVDTTFPRGLMAMVLRGAQIAQPSLHVGSLLSPAAAALFPQTLTRCLGKLGAADSYGALPRAQFYRPGAKLGPVYRELDRNDTVGLRIRVPTRIEQGLADVIVLPAYTRQLERSLRAAGDPATLATYRGASHSGVLVAAAANATAFLLKQLPPG